MTRRSALAIGMLVASVLAFVRPASAQTAPDNPWRHGTTLDLFAGSATDSASTRGTLGGGFGWEINHWVELEGTGAWVVARDDDEAFAAELRVKANLTRPNTVVPFVGAGVGMYRAMFGATSGAIPEFYQRRMDGPPSGSSTFTDPSFIFSGGVEIFAGGRLSFRPEFSVRAVTHDSDAHLVTMFTVRATYHFELHQVK